jgi:hypothetical protein
MTTYRHTQIGYAILYPMIAIALFVGIIVSAALSVKLGVLIALIVLAMVVTFYKLTIVVDDTHVRAVFGPGFTFRKIRLADITVCEPIRIRWWYGWGIHLTPYGWLYNVAGWDAVAITLCNGRRVSLGTDQPEELCAAIRRLASTR